MKFINLIFGEMPQTISLKWKPPSSIRRKVDGQKQSVELKLPSNNKILFHHQIHNRYCDYIVVDETGLFYWRPPELIFKDFSQPIDAVVNICYDRYSDSVILITGDDSYDLIYIGITNNQHKRIGFDQLFGDFKYRISKNALDIISIKDRIVISGRLQTIGNFIITLDRDLKLVKGVIFNNQNFVSHFEVRSKPVFLGVICMYTDHDGLIIAQDGWWGGPPYLFLDKDLNELKIDTFQDTGLLVYPDFLITFDDQISNIQQIDYKTGIITKRPIEQIPKSYGLGVVINKDYSAMLISKGIVPEKPIRFTPDELNDLQVLFNFYIFVYQKLLPRDILLHLIRISPYSFEIKSMIERNIFSMSIVTSFDEMLKKSYYDFVNQNYYRLLLDILNPKN